MQFLSYVASVKKSVIFICFVFWFMLLSRNKWNNAVSICVYRTVSLCWNVVRGSHRPAPVPTTPIRLLNSPLEKAKRCRYVHLRHPAVTFSPRPAAGLTCIYSLCLDQPSARFPPSPGHGQSQEWRAAGGEVSSCEKVWVHRYKMSTQVQNTGGKTQTLRNNYRWQDSRFTLIEKFLLFW